MVMIVTSLVPRASATQNTLCAHCCRWENLPPTTRANGLTTRVHSVPRTPAMGEAQSSIGVAPRKPTFPDIGFEYARVVVS